MHLQQTKRGSRASGGPQYYFHDLDEHVVTYLRKKRAVPVALVTPYGATPSHFVAVSKDAKLMGERAVLGKVGHDRIQKARAGSSIGEAVRDWYKLSTGVDFERIDVEIMIHDGRFYLTPIAYKIVGKSRIKPIQRPELPLSYNHRFESQLWRQQLRFVETRNADAFKWAIQEIARVARAHQQPKTATVLESDLLRASGPLNVLGMELSPYLGKGIDCRESRFKFLRFDSYQVPVEVKKRSSGFKYQQAKYGEEELSRTVILCANHDMHNVPPNVDVVELFSLAKLVNS